MRERLNKCIIALCIFFTIIFLFSRLSIAATAENQMHGHQDPFIYEIIDPFIEGQDDPFMEGQKWDSAVHWLQVEVEKDSNYSEGWFYLAKAIVLALQNQFEEAISSGMIPTHMKYSQLDFPGLLKTSLDNYIRLDTKNEKGLRFQDASRLKEIVSKTVKRDYNPNTQELSNDDIGEVLSVMVELLELIKNLDKFEFWDKPLPHGKKREIIPGMSEDAKFLIDTQVILASAMWLKKEKKSPFTLRQLCSKLYEKYGQGRLYFGIYADTLVLIKADLLFLDEDQWVFKLGYKAIKEWVPIIAEIMEIPWP